MNSNRNQLLLSQVSLRGRCIDIANTIIDHLGKGANAEDIACLLEDRILTDEWPAVLRYIESVIPKPRK